MRKLRTVLPLMLLIAWPSVSAGQHVDLAKGDTLVADTAGFFLTDAQFKQFASAVDSLDFWRDMAEAEERHKLKWRDLYTRLDSIYEERDQLEVGQSFGVRDATFWALLGGAATVVVNEVLENGS